MDGLFYEGNFINDWYRPNGDLVVTNGVFDVLHYGHCSYLQKARKMGAYLLVGINDDESVKRLKGPARPVNTALNRAGVLLALKCVDAVCIFSGTDASRFLKMAKPHIWVKGGDYTLETMNQDERKVLAECDAGVRFVPLIGGLSTTETIKRLCH